MVEFERLEFDSGDCKWIVKYLGYIDVWDTRFIRAVALKCVGEDPGHLSLRIGHQVDGHRRLRCEVECPEVIETGDVIVMVMCVDYCVERINLVEKTLLSEIGRGIDDDASISILYPNRGT